MKALKTLLALSLLYALPAAAQEHSEQFHYRIHHLLWGDIGTIAEDVRHDGSSTRVVTKLDIHVALFGLTLHDAHGTWSETWEGGTLKEFHATTLVDGTTEITEGRNEGKVFAILAGTKRSEAPIDVQPVNPWSLQFVHAKTLMSPETGRLIPATSEDDGMISVQVGGSSERLHHYVVDAAGQHHLYFDADGTLVQFEFSDITGKATITLDRPRAIAIAAK
jgi:uncharacterized protein DUF6134